MKSKFLILLAFLTTISFGASLQLMTDASTFLQYEPFLLQVKYEGDAPISLDPIMGDVSYSIYSQNTGETYVYNARAHMDRLEGEKVTGIYRVSRIFPIACDDMGWVFPQPGDYYVVAKVNATGFVSSPLYITILEPSKDEDIKVAQLLEGEQEFPGFAFREGTDLCPNALNLAIDIASGNSSYRKAMRNLLITHYCQTSCTPKGEVRLPAVDEALRYLNMDDNAPIATAQSIMYIIRAFPKAHKFRFGFKRTGDLFKQRQKYKIDLDNNVVWTNFINEGGWQ